MKGKDSRKSRTSRTNRLDIRTVAEAAGVSVATVSRVINNVPSVDPILAKGVWKVIKRLGYVPNTQARALVSGHSRLFGLIISEITNPFFPELIRGFEEKAVELGYETLIGSTSYDLRRMEICVQRMLERKVEGVAVMTFGIEEPLLDRLAAQGIPMVFIDHAPHKKNISAIHIEYRKGIQEAMQHLASLGHRDIAFFGGPPHLHSAAARLKAFKEAATGLGLRVQKDLLLTGDHTADGGRRCAQQLLALSHRPTAVLCSNDMTAIGAMHAFSSAGLSIPDDISIIGFDDISLAEFMLPPLTTIRMSGHTIAEMAVETLYKKDSLDRQVETHLVLRQTTAAPSGSGKKSSRLKGTKRE